MIKTAIIIIKCENCGEEFRKKSNVQKYCSSVCRHKKFKSSHDGYFAEYQRNWRRESPEKARAHDKKMRKHFRKKRNEYRKNYDQKFPEKLQARRAVLYAVKNGDLLKPDKCETCGARGEMLFGHHHDYAKRLDVKWLCGLCHSEVHPIETIK